MTWFFPSLWRRLALDLDLKHFPIFRSDNIRRDSLGSCYPGYTPYLTGQRGRCLTFHSLFNNNMFCDDVEDFEGMQGVEVPRYAGRPPCTLR